MFGRRENGVISVFSLFSSSVAQDPNPGDDAVFFEAGFPTEIDMIKMIPIVTLKLGYPSL